MTDGELYKLAVELVIAEIHSNFISQSTMGREDQIEDRIAMYHDRLRNQWRSRHQTGNIEPFPGSDGRS
ncbi:hypothetical protein ACW5XW_02830 [Aeromonas piscicola]|uniref:hypothetical protein n=1 Tax=Aeromonas piscicola TaxID=600645 RepID=UPI0005B41EDB|nr:hypothetical protein [Aeromonas piscicola]